VEGEEDGGASCESVAGPGDRCDGFVAMLLYTLAEWCRTQEREKPGGDEFVPAKYFVPHAETKNSARQRRGRTGEDGPRLAVVAAVHSHVRWEQGSVTCHVRWQRWDTTTTREEQAAAGHGQPGSVTSRLARLEGGGGGRICAVGGCTRYRTATGRPSALRLPPSTRSAPVRAGRGGPGCKSLAPPLALCRPLPTTMQPQARLSFKPDLDADGRPLPTPSLASRGPLVTEAFSLWPLAKHAPSSPAPPPAPPSPFLVDVTGPFGLEAKGGVRVGEIVVRIERRDSETQTFVGRGFGLGHEGTEGGSLWWKGEFGGLMGVWTLWLIG
jgi:hypothetical protein